MIRMDAILLLTFFRHFPQILFLDVLFPLSVKKIIYVDADQGTFVSPNRIEAFSPLR